MCKVFIIPSIKESKREKTIALVKAMAKKISVGNSDGLGYAAIDKHGSLFGERWWINSDAFKSLTDYEPVLLPFVQQSIDNEASKWHSTFGEGSLQDAVSITLHARFATSGKEFKNTHPFIENDTSLIHNGVISNTSDFTFTLSTCDSEAILKAYLKEGVGENISKAQDMANSLYGYYVAAMYSRDSRGNRILDVFKANNNSFCMVWINEIETYVIASSYEDVKSVCYDLGLTTKYHLTYKDGVFFRINPFTGELLDSTTFTFNDRNKPYVYSQPSIPWRSEAEVMNITKGKYKYSRPRTTNITEEEMRYFSMRSGIEEASGYYD